VESSRIKIFKNLIRLDYWYHGVHMLEICLEQALAGLMAGEIEDAFLCEVASIILAKGGGHGGGNEEVLW
jgi:hypothetical protein